MPDANAKDNEAQEICKEAMQQKTEMLHFCTTVQALEEELMLEEKVVDEMHMQRNGGKAGDMLSQGLAVRRKTIVDLNKELVALVEGQNTITKKAAEHAGKLLGELEANSAQMKKDKSENTIAIAFLKATNKKALQGMKDGHVAALQAKDDDHHAAKSKINKDHENAKSELKNERAERHPHPCNVDAVKAARR